MATQEIPQEQWLAFFDGFSRQHQGWLATLEVFGPEIGAQKEARNLPLEGITADLKGPESETISISFGKGPEEHVTHLIKNPKRIWLEQSLQGANAALEIESSDEVKTLLRFRSTLPTEMLNGVVLEP